MAAPSYILSHKEKCRQYYLENVKNFIDQRNTEGNEDIWYVYEHRRLSTGEVFYIGIGSQVKFRRAYSKSDRKKYWHNIVAQGHFVNIFATRLTKSEAVKIEVSLIKLHGRKDLKTGTLVNVTNGGEGANKPSPETIQKIKAANVGRKQSAETIQKRKITRGEIVVSAETRAKMSASSKGRKKSPEHIEKLRIISKNRITSEKTREILRQQGLAQSPERRKKISESVRRVWDTRRLNKDIPLSFYNNPKPQLYGK